MDLFGSRYISLKTCIASIDRPKKVIPRISIDIKKHFDKFVWNTDQTNQIRLNSLDDFMKRSTLSVDCNMFVQIALAVKHHMFPSTFGCGKWAVIPTDQTRYISITKDFTRINIPEASICSRGQWIIQDDSDPLMWHGMLNQGIASKTMDQWLDQCKECFIRETLENPRKYYTVTKFVDIEDMFDWTVYKYDLSTDSYISTGISKSFNNPQIRSKYFDDMYHAVNKLLK